MGICLVMGLLSRGMDSSSIFRQGMGVQDISARGACNSSHGFRGGVMVSLVWSYEVNCWANSLDSRALSACDSWSGTCA